MKDGAPHPVELLRDQHGVYGIGVSELFDFEAVAWSCGDRAGTIRFERAPRALILRPDRFSRYVGRTAPCCRRSPADFGAGPSCALTRSSSGNSSITRRSIAPGCRGHRHRCPTDCRWWSADKKQQARNRGIYHGLRRLSLHVVNHLIGAALEEAADADAVKAARRFTFEHRESIYRAGALSRRALQLTDTFPVLALAIYSDHHSRFCRRDTDFEDLETELADLAERRSHAADLVDRGARLRDVAGVMGMPMALRHIKPGVAHLATEIFCQHPELLRFMPDTTPSSRIWLRVVSWAHDEGERRIRQHGPRGMRRKFPEISTRSVASWATLPIGCGRECRLRTDHGNFPRRRPAANSSRAVSRRRCR